MIACAIGAIQSRNKLLRRVTFRVFGTMLALAGLNVVNVLGVILTIQKIIGAVANSPKVDGRPILVAATDKRDRSQNARCGLV